MKIPFKHADQISSIYLINGASHAGQFNNER